MSSEVNNIRQERDALAAIDRDPLGAREEISGMLLFLRSQAEGGA